MSDQTNSEAKPFYKKTWFFILAGVFAIGGLSSVIGGDESAENEPSQSSSETQDVVNEEEPSPVEVQIVDVVGLSGDDASAALEQSGLLDLEFVDLSDKERAVFVASNWKVCSTSPSAGSSLSSDDRVELLVVKEDESCESPNSTQQELAGPITSPEQLQSEIEAFLGESTNRDTSRSVEVSKPLAETPWYRISFEVDDSLFGSVQDVALKDFREIFPIIERADFVEEVSFVALYPLVDNTGQIFIEEVVDLYFAPEVFDRIVIENVTSEMFLESATDVYIHPAIQDAE